MSFETFVQGGTVTDAQMDNLMSQCVIRCTSSTRPTSPAPMAGMTIYETDTHELLQYTTVTTGWKRPWMWPWGHVASWIDNGAVGSIGPYGTATTDFPSATVTFNAVANRLYRIDAQIGQWSSPGSTTNLLLSVYKDGALLDHLASENYVNGRGAIKQYLSGSVITTATTGSHTYKIVFKFSAGANNRFDTTTTPGGSNIIIQDIGPVPGQLPA